MWRIISFFIIFNFTSNADAGLLSRLVSRNGQDVVIASGEARWLDSGMNSKYINTLTVYGTLKCPTGNTQNLHLRVVRIKIMNGGTFDCGQVGNRVFGKITISLMQDGHNGGRDFMVHSGGTLYLHGDSTNSNYSLLRATSSGSNSSLALSTNTQWRRGDLIGLSSGNFNYNQAETFTLRSGDGSSTADYTLNRNPTYAHYGDTPYTLPNGRRMTSGGSVAVNLTRNIVIQSAGSIVSNKGGHVMVMSGGQAYIDAVLFKNLGRQYEKGRYPVHWHQVGDASGQYVRNSVIYKSRQRCIVIHDTDRLLVTNNVCYDHYGHGIFLEDGGERFNRITHNVVMLSRKMTQPRGWTGDIPLASEINGTQSYGRWHAPSSFWISHPQNIVQDNIAAGSQGTGFWMSFKNKNERNTNPRYAYTPDWYFFRNRAHSNRIGFTWDGVDQGTRVIPEHYSPRHPRDRAKEKPVIRRLTAFKNLEAGIYYRGDAALFYEALLSDNRWSFFVAYSQELRTSLINGMTNKMTSSELNNLRRHVQGRDRSTSGNIGGILVYDGPFIANTVRFNHFAPKAFFAEGGHHMLTSIPFINIGGHRRYPNIVKGLQFYGTYGKKVYFRNTKTSSSWADNGLNLSIIDLDGSLTGRGKKTQVFSNTNISNYGGCDTHGHFQNAILCDGNDNITNYRFELFSNNGVKTNTSKIFYTLVNPDGAVYRVDHLTHSNKFNAIDDFSYEADDKVYKVYPGNQRLPNNQMTFYEAKRFRIFASSQGTTDSPAKIYIHGKKNCRRVKGVGATQYSQGAGDLQKFNDHAGSAYLPYRREDGAYGLYVKLKARSKHFWHRHAAVIDLRENFIEFQCE